MLFGFNDVREMMMMMMRREKKIPEKIRVFVDGP
jgi:hypothetical protein